MYAHLSRAFVERGETVTARQIIGRAGCTGSCTGTHLHFQAWRHGKLIDPLDLLGRHAFDDFWCASSTTSRRASTAASPDPSMTLTSWRPSHGRR